MHQPFYKDLVRQCYVMPWAYLHGTKDYLGMPALAEEFPDVHQTFNLVPIVCCFSWKSTRNGTAQDASLELAFKPVDELTPEERSAIIERFFPVPVRTMLQPFPAISSCMSGEAMPRGTVLSPTRISATFRSGGRWSGWIRIAGRKILSRKAESSARKTKRPCAELVQKTIQDIIPEYRKMQDQGSIEISTTPFYHPILPLLIDSQVDGNVPVDMSISHTTRANSLRGRRPSCEKRFGKIPEGLWPSEGFGFE